MLNLGVLLCVPHASSLLVSTVLNKKKTSQKAPSVENRMKIHRLRELLVLGMPFGLA